jgi:hypothetical protein
LGTPVLAASIQSDGEKAAGAGSVEKRPAVLDFNRQSRVTNRIVAEQLALEVNTHDGLPHACLPRARPFADPRAMKRSARQRHGVVAFVQLRARNERVPLGTALEMRPAIAVLAAVVWISEEVGAMDIGVIEPTKLLREVLAEPSLSGRPVQFGCQGRRSHHGSREKAQGKKQTSHSA